MHLTAKRVATSVFSICRLPIQGLSFQSLLCPKTVLEGCETDYKRHRCRVTEKTSCKLAMFIQAMPWFLYISNTNFHSCEGLDILTPFNPSDKLHFLYTLTKEFLKHIILCDFISSITSVSPIKLGLNFKSMFLYCREVYGN